ncbi:MAG: DUF2933 domain-containing protein [Candidatus Aenigmarchaeota archaeon]|nr:DUF2933 domain-containing protein [Candidatus Aenigmarchaeota archaeon]
MDRKDPVCGMNEEAGKGKEANGKWFCSEACMKKFNGHGGCCGGMGKNTVLIIIVAGAVLYFTYNRLSISPFYLMLLICPLMHIFMMRKEKDGKSCH